VDITPPSVASIAGDTEIEHAIATLVLAFATDPVARWMYNDPHQYLVHIPRLFRALGASSFEARAAQRTSDGTGIAIWLPPGVHGEDGPLEAVIAGSIVGERQAEAVAVFAQKNIIGRLSPIGICRSSGSKLCIGTRGVVQHYCSTAFANATGNTTLHTFGHRTR
jgi:hypothetical protein